MVMVMFVMVSVVKTIRIFVVVSIVFFVFFSGAESVSIMYRTTSTVQCFINI